MESQRRNPVPTILILAAAFAALAAVRNVLFKRHLAEFDPTKPVQPAD